MLHSSRSKRLHEDGAHDASAIDKIGSWNGNYRVFSITDSTFIKKERIRNMKISAKFCNIITWISLIDAQECKLMLRSIL